MSALKRNSTSSWDSVAMETQRCASAADARFTPSGCRRQALVLHRWRRELWTPRTLPPLQLMSGWRSCATRCGEHGWGRGGAPSEQNLEPKEQAGAAFLRCCMIVCEPNQLTWAPNER
jgi:hypothetical protein